MLRALLISLPCLWLFPQTVAAADKTTALVEMPADAPHPAKVLSELFPGASTGPQRLERALSDAERAKTLETLAANYGPPTNGRRDTIVWDVPNTTPQLDQADHASIIISRDRNGQWRLVMEDRAPRGSFATSRSFENRGQRRAKAVSAHNSAVRGKSATVKTSIRRATVMGDADE